MAKLIFDVQRKFMELNTAFNYFYLNCEKKILSPLMQEEEHFFYLIQLVQL